jgi:hypothetical protein
VETCQEWLLPYLGACHYYDLLPGQDEARLGRTTDRPG